MHRAKNKNTLNLVGDGDDADLIESLESSFGISFGENELADVVTLGDLHQSLLRRLSNTSPGPRMHCRSAAAFRALRRSFSQASSGSVRPSTPIATLIEDRRESDAIRQIEAHSGLSLDSLVVSAGVMSAALAIASAASIGAIILWPPHDSPLANTVMGLFWTAIVWLILVGLFLSATGDRFMRLDRAIATVGDLADRAAHLNFAKLSGGANQNHPDDVWRTLTWLCRKELGHAGHIDRDTRLFP